MSPSSKKSDIFAAAGRPGPGRRVPSALSRLFLPSRLSRGALASVALVVVVLSSVPSARAVGARAGLGGFRWSTATPQANTLNSVAAPLPGTNGVGLLAVGDATTFMYRQSPLQQADDGWLCGRGRRIDPDVSYRDVAFLRATGRVAVVADNGTVLVGDGCRMETRRVTETPLNAAAWTRFPAFERLAVVGANGAAFFADSEAASFEPAVIEPGLPAPPDLLALHVPPATAPGVGYAAGRSLTQTASVGVVLKTTDGGKTWAPLPGLPFADLYVDVFFLSPTTGFALGAREGKGLLVRTLDGGAKWEPVASVDGFPRALAAFDTERVVIVGDGGIWLSLQGRIVFRPQPVEGLTEPIPMMDVDVAGSEAWAVGRAGVVFYSTDGGDTWAPFSRSRVLNEQQIQPFYAMQYLSDKDVVVAGRHGALLRSMDGGETFQPMPNPVREDILALAAPGSRNAGVGAFAAAPGVAAGSRRTLLTFDSQTGGWTPRSTVPGVDLFAATMLDAGRSVWTWAVGEGGAILSRDTSSPLWTVQKSGTTRRLNAVQAIRTDKGTQIVAVGDSGTILRSRDGGTWNPILTLPTPFATRNLRGVFFRTLDVGYVVGDGGLIAATFDGGATWRVPSLNTTSDLYAVAAAPIDQSDEVFAVGAHQAVLRSADNGATWTIVRPPVQGSPLPDFIYRAVQVVAKSHVFIAGEQDHLLELPPGAGWIEHGFGGTNTFFALRMLDATTGMAVAYNVAAGPRVAFTTTGWEKPIFAAVSAGTPPLYGGDMLGRMSVVVGAAGTILSTTDAFVSAPSYRSETPAIRAVVSPKAGEYLAAGDDALLVRSPDDGATWQDVPLANPFGPDVVFRALGFFPPDATGNAVGFLAGEVPGKNVPVLFRSTDSGRTWEPVTLDFGADSGGIHALAAFSGMVLAGADNGAVYLFDGTKWDVHRPIPGFTGAWNAISATDARWYVVGDLGRAARWPDARGNPRWLPLNTGTRNNLRGISGPPLESRIGLAAGSSFEGGLAGGGSGGGSEGGPSGGGGSLRDDIRGVCMDPSGVFLTDTGGLSLFGDVNRDTEINVVDERAVLTTLAGQSLPTEEVVFFGDMDPPAPEEESLPGDGNLTISDAVRLLRTAMGL